ncbi:MAG TPA: hypothetical protein PKV84_01580 [Candidatus Omnitrophota bacterium]|nr:hypothetical protein [Candidatus Omnitrophota bacterium]
MGYYTDFNGSIDLPGLSEKDGKHLRNIVRRRFPDSSGEIRIEQDKDGYRLEIFANWKNYHEEFQRFVMAIVRAFPKCASGWIDASGEERDDSWALEVGEGKVMFIGFERVAKDRAVYFDAKGGRHHD